MIDQGEGLDFEGLNNPKLQPGELLFDNTIEVIKKIGEGAQSKVYLGENKKTHKKVAIKQI